MIDVVSDAVALGSMFNPPEDVLDDCGALDCVVDVVDVLAAVVVAATCVLDMLVTRVVVDVLELPVVTVTPGQSA